VSELQKNALTLLRLGFKKRQTKKIFFSQDFLAPRSFADIQVADRQNVDIQIVDTKILKQFNPL
jgi:hypothetical protein